VLLTVAVGGSVAVALVPDDSKTAVGLGVVALVIAAGNYATNPDWEELAKDVQRLREIADSQPSPLIDFPPPESGQRNCAGPLRYLMVGLLIAWIYRARALKKTRKPSCL
jgi:hypothetical protein